MGRRLRCLIAIGALAALAGCGSSPASQGISVHVDTSPFRVTVLDNGKAVVSEDKAARLRFELASTGDEYTLTKVTSSKGGVYQVATTEPGRTATVTVATTATAAEIKVVLHPATGIQAVYDAFDTAAGRALSRRRREGRVGRPARPDPADPGRVRMLEHPDPVLCQLGRLGDQAGQPAERRARLPRLDGRIRLRGRRGLAVQLPGSDRPGRGVPAGRHARRAPLRRLAPAVARRLRDRDRGADRAAAVAAGADQVARRRQRPRSGARGRPPPSGGEDPDRLGAARQPVGGRLLQRAADVRPVDVPGPRRADLGCPPARRQVHALGLAARDVRRRLPRQAARRARPPDPRPPRPGRGRRVPAAHPRPGGAREWTGSRPTVGTRPT